MKLPVHRIIPFSNVEGYGNRTSIFVQGCNANCLYCHNSETIPMRSKDATLQTVDNLLEIIKHQQPFIRGITISGGEATLYHSFLTELFQAVHKLGLTCYVDTNGFFNLAELEALTNVTDKFLYDVKAIGPSLEKLCFSNTLLENNHLEKNNKERFITNHEHITNLIQLLKQDKIEEVRHVYVKGLYDGKEVIDQMYEILKEYPNVLFKLIKMHHRGLPKERILSLKGNLPSTKEYDELVEYTKNKGFHKLEIIK